MSDSNDEKVKLREKIEFDTKMACSIAEYSSTLSNLILRKLVEGETGPLTADNFKIIITDSQREDLAIEIMLGLIFNDETIDDPEKKEIWLLLGKHRPSVVEKVFKKISDYVSGSVSKSLIVTKDFEQLLDSK